MVGTLLFGIIYSALDRSILASSAISHSALFECPIINILLGWPLIRVLISPHQIGPHQLPPIPIGTPSVVKRIQSDGKVEEHLWR